MSRNKTCLRCGRERRILARGLCYLCYISQATRLMSDTPRYVLAGESKVGEQAESSTSMETPDEPLSLDAKAGESCGTAAPIGDCGQQGIRHDVGDGKTTCFACGKKLGRFHARGLCNTCWKKHVSVPLKKGVTPLYPDLRKLRSSGVGRMSPAGVVTRRPPSSSVSTRPGATTPEAVFWGHAVWLAEELRLEVHDTFAFTEQPSRIADHFPGFRVPLRDDQELTMEVLTGYSVAAFASVHPLCNYLGAVMKASELKHKVQIIEEAWEAAATAENEARNLADKMVIEYVDRFEE